MEKDVIKMNNKEEEEEEEEGEDNKKKKNNNNSNDESFGSLGSNYSEDTTKKLLNIINKLSEESDRDEKKEQKKKSTLSISWLDGKVNKRKNMEEKEKEMENNGLSSREHDILELRMYERNARKNIYYNHYYGNGFNLLNWKVSIDHEEIILKRKKYLNGYKNNIHLLNLEEDYYKDFLYFSSHSILSPNRRRKMIT